MNIDDPQFLLWLKRTLTACVLPPTGPALLALCGLLLLRRYRRVALTLLWSGVLGSLLLSQPLTVGSLIAPLETTPPLLHPESTRAQAIVVLGAGKRAHAPEYGGSTLSPLSLERLRYGAYLARRTGLPLLLSGGSDGDPWPEADLMKAAAEKEFQVPVRWVESAARNTEENAQFSAALLSGARIGHILLVTHAAHMPRAQAAFERAGLSVTPAPTGWMAPPPSLYPADAQSVQAGRFAAREWLALTAEKLRSLSTPLLQP